MLLFKKNGELVLHRVIEIDDEKYVLRGDRGGSYDTIFQSEIIAYMKCRGHFKREMASTQNKLARYALGLLMRFLEKMS